MARAVARDRSLRVSSSACAGNVTAQPISDVIASRLRRWRDMKSSLSWRPRASRLTGKACSLFRFPGLRSSRGRVKRAAMNATLHRLGPAVLGASAFACADVLGKVALNAGADVLTTVTIRSYVGLVLLHAWLRFGVRPEPIGRRAVWISLGLGVLFTGNIFGLFKAFDLVEVPIAVLTYFVYPLLTGLAAAATGLEALTARSLVAAVV